MTLDELRRSPRAALTVTEVAALLEVDERTVRRACEDGQLPALHVGRRILIPRERLLPLLTTPTHTEGPDATSGPTATTEAVEEPRYVTKDALRAV
jgi:excisionase family DNA binding protein